MTNQIASLRNARKNPHRYLLEYLNLRSRIGYEKLICIFEGKEDLPVYDVWIRRIFVGKYEPLIVKGKENVLDLNVLLQINTSAQDSKVLFFVDSDFDGCKGRKVDNRLFLTPCYSIENLLVSRQTFEDLLIYDLGLINNEQDSRQPLVELFQLRLDEYNKTILPINAYIRWISIENVEPTSFPDSIAQYLTINIDCISAKFGNNLSEIIDIFQAKATPLPSTLQEHISWFEQHDLTLVGRGKFILDFVKRFLSELYKDRRSNNPKYFKNTDKTLSDPSHDLIRKLAVYTNCPSCLEIFLQEHLN